MGLNSELSKNLVSSGFDLENYQYDLDLKLIANILVEIPKDIKSRYNLDYEFKEKDFRFVLEALELNKISKDSVTDIFIDIVNGKKVDFKKYVLVDSLKLEEEINKLVNRNKDLSIGALMGEVMKKFGGKVDGKLAAQLVAKYKNG